MFVSVCEYSIIKRYKGKKCTHFVVACGAYIIFLK